LCVALEAQPSEAMMDAKVPPRGTTVSRITTESNDMPNRTGAARLTTAVFAGSGTRLEKATQRPAIETRRKVAIQRR
jgi:hypothetical protein